MKARRNTKTTSLKDTIAAFGAMVQKEAEALATTAVESFKRGYKRRMAKSKTTARASTKRAAKAVAKAAKTTVRRAKTATKQARKPRGAAKQSIRPRKQATRSRRRKSA